jgi:nucleoside-diphosphate-sugar epimerase
MKTIAITGSSGFIGKHLINKLKGNNYKILELDYNTGYDLSKWEDVLKIPEFDIIIHLASRSFVPESFINPHEYYRINFQITLNILELVRINSARVIYFSSYLYGSPKYLPIDENHPLAPHNPYSQTKIICEKVCEGYNRDFNVPVTIFRPFNIYGSGQDKRFLVPEVIQQLSLGKIIVKDPRPRRDFVHVLDVVQAVELAIGIEFDKLEVFNIGSGASVSVAEIVSTIKEVYNSSAIISYSNEYRQEEVLESLADIRKAKELLGWFPVINIVDGIKEIQNESTAHL